MANHLDVGPSTLYDGDNAAFVASLDSSTATEQPAAVNVAPPSHWGAPEAAVVAAACPSLKALRLWSISGITAPGIATAVASWPDLISFVAYSCDSFSDDDAAELAPLAQLEELNLYGCASVGPRGLRALTPLPSLTTLTLEYLDRITDAALIPLLSAAPGLTSLNITRCSKLTDAVLLALAEHAPSLTSLHVERVHGVTDAGLVALAAGCPQLTSLCTLSHAITDAGVAALAVLPLANLNLAYSAVSDAGLAALLSGPSLCASELVEIGLTGAKAVTDAGICALASQAPQLARFNLFRLPCVTDAGNRVVSVVNDAPSPSRAADIAAAVAAAQPIPPDTTPASTSI
ncbi:F-box/LRR-repeat protein 20 [Thecamonas trahens ATCC 50062]|uniref:F-box/LRR-repeat protein 20 n=1 Tax=Thecamonas trahens ATCC 50062 TaxID=461836 RepID=A0A0L0D5B4_THETB|nr:F-box/LRR-repeat protein 20 [Thecamonas trahens ATCC 50062]KNC47539.1 F-box/LRR-repeat protein 20 [Thecamonas trahens ATCC 50062]|eukprot:XP_013759471.1 F-box/LRR-repeat protein 20 [Thecamonas trahens ATCC 50062]